MSPERLLELYERISEAPDAVARLRRFILDLAVRGKLVEQDPGDEPASELLETISRKRKKLYAEKQIPKPKALPSIEEMELPFAVPKGWEWSMLGQLCYRVADGPHFSPQYVPPDNGVPFLSTRNVRPEGFDLSSVKYVSRADHEEFCKRIKPEPNDILYTKGGTTGIAKVNDLDFEFSVWVHLAVLRIEKERLFPRYIELALNSPHCYAQSQEYTRGISNFDLGLTRLIKITIPLPPLPEQHRIVAKVDELMALCDRLEEARTRREALRDRLTKASLARLSAPETEVETFKSHARFALEALPALTARPNQVKALRQTILDLAVRGKLVEQDPAVDRLPERYGALPQEEGMPVNWRLLNFGDFCDIEGGNQPPKSQFVAEPGPGYVRLFQIRDLGKRPVPTYIPENSTNRFCKKGEILIGRYGASVGKIFWAQDGAYNVALTKFIWPDDAFTPAFVFLILRSDVFQGHLAGATRSAQAGFNKKDLAPLNFPLPPLAEQHRIIAKVDELMVLCDRLETGLASGEDTRGRLLDAVLAEALAGDAVDEDASEKALASAV